jgi:hypothetical protein
MKRLAPHPAFAIAALPALVLTACAQTPPAVPEAPPPPVFAPGECDAQAAQFAVGQPYDEPLGEQARSRSHAERLRAVRPGQMVTMEFDARRLTLEIGADGRVVSARCG